MFEERYGEDIGKVKELWSEPNFYKEAVFVEIEYLIDLSEFINRKVSTADKEKLRKINKGFSNKNLENIKGIERKIGHDLKAVEYFIQNSLTGSLSELKHLIHFGLTSEDVKNIVWRRLLRRFVKEVYVPQSVELIEVLLDLAKKHKSLPILSRTHTQPASPTTLGKVFVYFANRLAKNLELISNSELHGKLGGSVGDFHEFHVSYPEKDWIVFSRKFVESMGLKHALITTQIAPYDDVANLLRLIVSTNQIVYDLNQHCWLYIRDGWLKQKFGEHHVGSSVMPHKVNPIDFENSMGNIIMADILNASANGLQISEDHRKLHDSVIMRSLDRGLAHSILSYSRSVKSLKLLEPNRKKIEEDIKDHPEVITAAVQTILRKYGKEDAYEKLRRFSQGKELTLEDIQKFVKGLKVAKDVKKSILKLKPESYIGLSEKLTELGIKVCRETIRKVAKAS